MRYRVVTSGKDFHLIDSQVEGRTLTLYVDRPAAESDAQLLNGAMPLGGRVMPVAALSQPVRAACAVPARHGRRQSVRVSR